MAFTTFILLTGFYQGVKAEFEPEIIGYVFSKSMFFWVLEALIQKGFLYFSGFGNPPFFEVLAYTGYKFVSLCLLVAISFFLNGIAYFVALIALALVFAFFFFQTLRRFSTANTLADHIRDVSINRKTFMLVNSVIQVVLIWVLSFN
mmetsp:Transcript_37098/g.27408  ORF Transcript_37098/g.27408 Transcript_37098/m.27408 type:complete len:147 (+) Transcript_37098:381-821(+)